jgi:8-oxo-dGTP pyrophosphatase MutT (NUDIX family)
MSDQMHPPDAAARVPVVPRPAAAVVLLRDGERGAEVFMVRRHVRSEFVPDVYVFPGGTVKGDDAETERTPGRCAPAGESGYAATALGAGFRVAALRECFEEAGVLLARRDGAPLALSPADVPRFADYRQALNDRTLGLGDVAEREGLLLATDELLHWAHWITPETYPMRFDTHFFLAAMPGDQQAAHDELETTAGAWLTPAAALDRFERGDFPLVFATIHQLRALHGCASVADARARFAGAVVRTIQPRVVTAGGVETITLPDEAG